MSSTTIYHIHHKIPRYMGGTDDPSNLIELTIEEHALAHKRLYEQYGNHQDFIAWKALSGQITYAEATKLAQSLRDTSYMQTKKYKDKMSKSKLGCTAWNKGKTGVQDFSKITGSNNYRSVSCSFKGKEYSTIREAMEDTGMSKYRLYQHPDFIRQT